MSASQASALRLFTALRLLRASWAGALLVGIGLDAAGCELALAAQAAGAAALLLEGDTEILREAQRRGCCNFHVTTLDEALRTLKNEVRQGRAIAVALRGDPAGWLAEMVERGVLPQAVVAARAMYADETADVARLAEWGSRVVSYADLLAVVQREMDGWEMVEDLAASMTERRKRDASLLDGEDLLDTNAVWLRCAPSLFPRDLSRVVWRSEKAVR